MSRWRSRNDEAGFTLIEVIVAIALLAVVAAAIVPVLIAGLRAAQFAKTSTQAKNLGQLRLERMRDLTFHVDAQNGPYVDLLDDYFTSVSQTSFTEEPAIDDANATSTTNGHAVGRYVASCPLGIMGRPCFQVQVLGVPGYATFAQDIYTQFLTSDTNALAPDPTYKNSPTASAVGVDTPPSLLVGVTIVTSYKLGAVLKSTSVYSQIADTRGQRSLLDVQARAAAVYVTSTSPDGTVVQGGAGISDASGSQSSGSTVSASAEGAFVNETGSGRLDTPCFSYSVTNPCPAVPTASAPDTVFGTTAKYTGPMSSNGNTLGSGSCGRSHVGPGSVSVPGGSDWGTIASGLAAVPSNAVPSSTANLLTGSVRAAGGGGCRPFSYSNNTTGAAFDALLALDPLRTPLSLADTSGSGSIASGATTIATSNATLSVHPVTSYMRTDLSGSTELDLLPSTNVAATSVSLSHNRSVIYIVLKGTSDLASLSCSSTSAAVADYHMTVYVWDGLSLSYMPFNADYDSTSASATSLPVLPDPSIWLIAPGVPLSQYLASGNSPWGFNSLQIDSTSGARSFGNVGAAFSVSTAPLFDAVTDPNRLSGLTVSVGRLSCVADDVR